MMEKRNLRKERVGVVTSNKMAKSIVVAETKKVKHPLYGKFVLKTKKNMLHTTRKMTVTLVIRYESWRLVL